LYAIVTNKSRPISAVLNCICVHI